MIMNLLGSSGNNLETTNVKISLSSKYSGTTAYTGLSYTNKQGKIVEGLIGGYDAPTSIELSIPGCMQYDGYKYNSWINVREYDETKYRYYKLQSKSSSSMLTLICFYKL